MDRLEVATPSMRSRAISKNVRIGPRTLESQHRDRCGSHNAPLMLRAAPGRLLTTSGPAPHRAEPPRNRRGFPTAGISPPGSARGTAPMRSYGTATEIGRHAAARAGATAPERSRHARTMPTHGATRHARPCARAAARNGRNGRCAPHGGPLGSLRCRHAAARRRHLRA